MDPIRREYEDEIEKSMENYKKDKKEMDKRETSSEFLIGMKQLGDAIEKGNENMCKLLQGRPNKLVKPAKVPSWSKSIKLEAYLKALQVWMEMNKNVCNVRMIEKDVMESCLQRL